MKFPIDDTYCRMDSHRTAADLADKSVSASTVYERNGVPPLVKLVYPLQIRHELFRRCEYELFERSEVTRAAGFSATFLLGVEKQAERFRETMLLVRSLHETLIALNESSYSRPFEFSFLKIARGKPSVTDEGTYYEGFHFGQPPPPFRLPRAAARPRQSVDASPRVCILRD